MCGIAGIVAPEIRKYKTALQRMVDTLHHRGPDGTGIHFFSQCALGHTRLSIIDLHGGHQPMLSPISKAGIIFNGEIYSYKSIRSSLDGYPFRTASDTEVILALYDRYGPELLSRLPGMFAFAIWDDSCQKLLCARDRFGEKPFYYAFGYRGEFLFASEIKALLASELIEPILNREAISHYMQYLYVHSCQTIYKNVYTLPPAHILRYGIDNRLTVERYWYLPAIKNDIKLSEAAEQFKQLFDETVAKQLVADVPVGAFLSGGLDSSSIVAVASRHQSRVKTISFGFDDSISELPFANQVARLYQTEHIELTDSQTDIGDLLMTMQNVYDEPFADSSNIPTYLISKLARQYVKVVLTGDGGDELLGGYPFWYKPLLHMKQRPSRYLWLIDLLLLTDRLLAKMGLPSKTFWQYRIRGMEYRKRYNFVAQAHIGQKQYFTDDELSQFGLNPPTRLVFEPEKYVTDTLDDALRMDIENYLPGDILVKIDRASMAHGLELRAPFLDVGLASFCISLPFRLKITTKRDKLILRQALADAWPPSIRARGKQGFGAPVNQWLKRDSVRTLKEKYLNNPRQRLFSLLPFDRTRNSVIRDNYQTWILLVLALWMDKHEFRLE